MLLALLEDSGSEAEKTGKEKKTQEKKSPIDLLDCLFMAGIVCSRRDIFSSQVG